MKPFSTHFLKWGRKEKRTPRHNFGNEATTSSVPPTPTVWFIHPISVIIIKKEREEQISLYPMLTVPSFSNPKLWWWVLLQQLYISMSQFLLMTTIMIRLDLGTKNIKIIKPDRSDRNHGLFWSYWSVCVFILSLVQFWESAEVI